jgi:hypothetical protein
MKTLTTCVLLAVLSVTPALAQPRGGEGGAVGGAAAGAVGGALIGGPVGAVIGGVAGAIAGGTVGSLTDDDRVYAQRYVYERQVAPVSVRDEIAIGRPLPRGVRTYTFEGNERLGPYRYAYVNNQYLLIDSNGVVLGAVVR